MATCRKSKSMFAWLDRFSTHEEGLGNLDLGTAIAMGAVCVVEEGAR
jgi:hypothetical protein